MPTSNIQKKQQLDSVLAKYQPRIIALQQKTAALVSTFLEQAKAKKIADIQNKIKGL